MHQTPHLPPVINPLLRNARKFLLVAVLLLSGSAGWPMRAQAQSITVNNPEKNTNYTLVSGQTLTIASNVKYAGTITVTGSTVTIINNGEIAGNVTVNAGVTSIVINNAGTVSSGNIVLNAPTTINNGYDGTAIATGAAWTGYVGANFKAAPTITNYATWTAQIQPLPGGAIMNQSSGTWSAYMTNSGSLTITNAGTWSGQIQTPTGTPTYTVTNTGTWSGDFQPAGATTIANSGTWSGSGVEYGSSLTVNHTAGTWTAGLNSGTSLTVNNSATWTKGINFPPTGPNSFTNQSGATTNFDAYVQTSTGATTITNSGSMTFTAGMSDITSQSSLTNNRGAVIGITGQLVNSGLIANAGQISVSQNFVNNASGTVSGPAAPYRGSIMETGGQSTNAGIFGSDGYLNFCGPTPYISSTNGFNQSSSTSKIGPNTTFCSARPLPVELTSFTARRVPGRVLVQWNTASERNSARFILERSADGQQFGAIQTVAAQGNSTQPVAYAATDAAPLAGTAYYRLRQLDQDGSVTFSSEVIVFADPNLRVSLYPNPATDHLTLDLTTAPAAPCEVRLVGLTGQVWRIITLMGGARREIPLAGVPAGLYLLQVRTSRGCTVQRLEKQ